MSLLMSCTMSLVISLFNVGFVHDIIGIWLRAWAFAFPVAFMAIMVVAPLVNKLVVIVLHEDNDGP